MKLLHENYNNLVDYYKLDVYVIYSIKQIIGVNYKLYYNVSPLLIILKASQYCVSFLFFVL